jgi:hypothetical protein
MPDVYDSTRPAVGVHHAPYKASEGGGAIPRLQVVREVLERTGEIRGSRVWGSYVVWPNKRFVNEQTDEEVVLLLRAHPITNIGWEILTVVMLVLPELLELTGMFNGVPTGYMFVGKLTWYLITLGFAFEKFLYWYYSVVIITNERVVDIDFVNLLHRVVSYAALNHIEEPSMVAGGLFRSLFHFGDVHVATAAEAPSVEAYAVPYPDRVVRVISELSEELEKRRERGE